MRPVETQRSRLIHDRHPSKLTQVMGQIRSSFTTKAASQSCMDRIYHYCGDYASTWISRLSSACNRMMWLPLHSITHKYRNEIWQSHASKTQVITNPWINTFVMDNILRTTFCETFQEKKHLIFWLRYRWNPCAVVNQIVSPVPVMTYSR